MKRFLTGAVLPVVLMSAVVFNACKKDKAPSGGDGNGNGNGTGTPTGTASRADLTRDSIFLYAKQVYLWNDALPTYDAFNPRKYTGLPTDLANFKKELFDISQIKINPTTGLPYEYYNPAPTYSKYSRIDTKSGGTVVISAPNIMNSTDENGDGNDYGIDYAGAYIDANSTQYAMFIIYVSPSSPAAKAGLHRGDIITKVNSSNIGPTPGNYNSDLTALDNALNQSTATLTVFKSNASSSTTVSLAKAKYNASPVFKDSVYTSGATKIGYIAYSQFTSEANSGTALRNTFTKFAAAGVTDLVVDLRYNGGGYETSAILLSNLIAPLSVSGQTMFTEYFNLTMQTGQATLLAKQPLLDQSGKQQTSNGRKLFYSDISYKPEDNTTKFSKEGTNNTIKKVVFIGTGNTASASELVINNLKPVMDVKIVGSQTYGKPVGFFPVYIDQYEVYYSMIGLKNSQGNGDYFAGFTPDYQAGDSFWTDWGNTTDASLKAAISYILTGAYTNSFSVSSAPKNYQPLSTNILRTSQRNNFKGLVVDHFVLK